MKNIIKFTIGMACVALIAMLVLNVIEHFTAKPSMIATSGECLGTAVKDRTAITLRVRALDKSASASMKIATAQMRDITAFVKTLDAEMQSTDFSSYEKTEWDQSTQKSITLGYETSLAVEVSAEQIETIEMILEKFAGNENVYTDNLRMFTSAKLMQDAMEKCLGTAVENARARAEFIAAADGKSVGKLVSAEYGSASVPSPVHPANFLRASAKMEAASFDMAGGLVSKDTEVGVNVNAVFEIE